MVLHFVLSAKLLLSYLAGLTLASGMWPLGPWPGGKLERQLQSSSGRVAGADSTQPASQPMAWLSSSLLVCKCGISKDPLYLVVLHSYIRLLWILFSISIEAAAAHKVWFTGTFSKNEWIALGRLDSPEIIWLILNEYWLSWSFLKIHLAVWTFSRKFIWLQ